MNISIIFKKEMVKLLFILLISSGIISCGKENKNESQSSKTETQTTETDKTGTDKSGTDLSNDFIVNYDLDGKLKGTMVIYRNGEKLKQTMNTEIMGVQNSNEVYIDGDNVYSVIEIGGQKIGNKTNLADYNKQKKTGETITDFKEFEKTLDDKKIIGTENIAGYDCDIYEISNGVNISVNNKRYVLRIRSPEFTATATALNTNPTFKDNEFDIPTGVDFKSLDIKNLNKQKIDSLVEQYKK